ncbi:hypothetical protein A0H81_09882 [Grifola frondosa]|uniref:Gamma-interferon-inducible lysosomal thiol reductase n=1 Tax=Grifola frondosa TaxID=5627 RepID=A0A1C7M1Q1_GRIFR|nr:hypothetical protein A0H81_09882 [Grifola frondosa]
MKAGLCALILGMRAMAGTSRVPLTVQTDPPQLSIPDSKVPVTLGVMSRCPDALLCESVFDYVLKRVADKVDMSLTFIGKLNSTEPDFGVTCMHGSDECAGNNYQGRDKIGTPATALQCAETVHIDWENSKVGECAGTDGSGKAAEGVQLLQESVQATRALGIEKSCTVLINGRQVCIRDGEWKECEGGHTPNDFVRQINEEYDKLNSV